MPRWIEEDILETQKTAPPKQQPFRHCHRGHHRYGKRRRKWCRRWHEYGMNQDPTAPSNRDLETLSDYDLYEPFVEIDISDDSFENEDDFRIIKTNPKDFSESHQHYNKRFPDKIQIPAAHPLSLSHVATETGRSTPDSVIENVSQISLKDRCMRIPVSNSSSPSQSLSNSIRNLTGIGTKEKTASSSVNFHSNDMTNSQDSQGGKDENEAMMTHDQIVVDIKPDVDNLNRDIDTQNETIDIKLDVDKLNRDMDTQNETNTDIKFDDYSATGPLSPVSSALLSYHGDGLSRSDSPSSALSVLHGKDLPDLLDARIKHFLDTGHVKVVWGKIVQVCASYLVNVCKGQPTSADYKWLCKAMYERYPTLGTTKGPRPWSCFNRAVSQKIRYTRWKIRQMDKK